MRDAHLKQVTSFSDLRSQLDSKCIVLAPFCGRPDCEDNIKRDSAREDVVEAGAALMGAKTLCLPIDQVRVTVEREERRVIAAKGDSSIQVCSL